MMSNKAKRPPGRPFQGGRDPLVSTRLPKPMIAALDKQAKAEGKSRNRIIREILAAALKPKG